MFNYNFNMLFLVDNINNKIELHNKNNMDVYNELKKIIIDHQNILK